MGMVAFQVGKIWLGKMAMDSITQSSLDGACELCKSGMVG